MKDRLYYDGACPLCLREVRLMRKHTSHYLDFIDIHQLTKNTLQPTKQERLKRLHLQRAKGDWLVGLDANVYAWSFNRYGKILRVLRWPVIRPVIDFIYNRWADRRYEKRYHCGECNHPNESS